MEQIRFSMKKLLLLFLFASYILAAFSRGNYLLGSGGTVVYTFVAILITTLFFRSFSESPVRRVPLALLVAFAIPISLVFAFPEYINSDFNHLIRKQSVERHAHVELSRLFASDPAFDSLTVTTTQLKVVNVEISGTVPTTTDLERLQSRVLSECDFPEQCVVHWRVTARGALNPAAM